MNWSAHISFTECREAMDFLLCNSGIDPPLVQQREVLSGESMGELINHYCKVNSDLSRYCPLFCLSSGQSKHRDDGLSWPKID